MQVGSISDATEVASKLLEATGAALRVGDFDGFFRCFHLPMTLATMDGVRHLATPEQIKLTFEQIRAHYDDIGLEHLDRWIAAALFDGPDLIRSCHVTRFINRDGQTLKAPVAALGRLERIDGSDWRIRGTQYTVHHNSDYGRALLGETREIDPASAATTAAEAVFQNVLDTVTRAYVEGDFALLGDVVQYPMFVQGSSTTQVLNSSDDLEADYRRYRTQFLVHRVTDAVRLVTHAEQVGERRIQGGYRTHILSGHQLVIPAYTSAMTVEQGDDLKWRMTSVIHPMGHLTLESKAAGAAGGARQ